MALKKYHRTTARDVEAVLYDGKNAEALAKEWPDVVTYDKEVHELRYRNGSSSAFLYPGTYLVRDGNEFSAVKESEFEGSYVEA